MWPFKSSEIRKQVAAALAPGALPSARERALDALMAMPQRPESLACYLRIALDQKQVWKTRYKAMEGTKLSPNVAGARALLQCLAIDLRRPALSMLCTKGFPEALRTLGAETDAVLAGALQRILADGERKFHHLLPSELDSLIKLLGLIATPGTKAMLPAVEAASARMRNLRVPEFLQCALTSKYHREVKDAVNELQRLDTAEAKAALEVFRRTKSRLVEKHVVPGVGCPDENLKRQVYTSELGQPNCDAELAQLAALRADWERRHPEQVAKAGPVPLVSPASDASPPPPPASAPADPVDREAQDYPAASARGVEEDLLALVENHLPFLQSLHAAESLAPLAASMDALGEINGHALTTRDDHPDAGDRGVEEVISFFQEQFRSEARQGRIVGCAVFFHGCHGPGRGSLHVAPAKNVDEADCIVALLDHRDGQALACVIQYRRQTGGGWKYDPAYFVPKRGHIFVDATGVTQAPNFTRSSLNARRPAAASDHGTHPELMILLETQFTLVDSCHRSGSPAPLAAWMKPSGEIQAGMVLNRDVWEQRQVTTNLNDPVVFFQQDVAEKTPSGAVAFFVDRLRTAAEKGEIVASAIFYHGIHDPELAKLGIMPAMVGEIPDCIVAQLDHRLSQAVSVVIPYAIQPDGTCQYGSIVHHPNYPLIFNEGGGSYEEHVTMKLEEALRALGSSAVPADYESWARRLRPMLPASPLPRAFLEKVIDSLDLTQQVTVLDHLAWLGRVEVAPLAAGLHDRANPADRTRLAELLIRCGDQHG